MKPSGDFASLPKSVELREGSRAFYLDAKRDYRNRNYFIKLYEV